MTDKQDDEVTEKYCVKSLDEKGTILGRVQRIVNHGKAGLWQGYARMYHPNDPKRLRDIPVGMPGDKEKGERLVRKFSGHPLTYLHPESHPKYPALAKLFEVPGELENG